MPLSGKCSKDFCRRLQLAVEVDEGLGRKKLVSLPKAHNGFVALPLTCTKESLDSLLKMHMS